MAKPSRHAASWFRGSTAGASRQMEDGFQPDFHETSSGPRLAFPALEDLTRQQKHGIVELVHHTLLERNNGVVGNVNVFRAHLSAALSDVAQADAQLVAKELGAGYTVERVHLQGGHANEKARPTKLFLLVVVAQDVAHVLTQEAFDTFAELLHAVHILLIELPLDSGPRLEGRDF